MKILVPIIGCLCVIAGVSLLVYYYSHFTTGMRAFDFVVICTASACIGIIAYLLIPQKIRHGK